MFIFKIISNLDKSIEEERLTAGSIGPLGSRPQNPAVILTEEPQLEFSHGGSMLPYYATIHMLIVILNYDKMV